jgi:hypothetical protein
MLLAASAVAILNLLLEGLGRYLAERLTSNN